MIDKIVGEALYKGYRYYIRRRSLDFRDFYCGYVEIPKDHSLYEVDYDDLEHINVHGGLTFSGRLDFSDEYLLGFDCAHDGDDTSVEDANYTANECERLIDQLIEVEE